MNFYIFRHGATYYSKRDLDYGADTFTAKILPEAKSVIEKMAKYIDTLPSDINVSSPVLRCKQTVEIIEQNSNKKFEFDSRLGEYDKYHEETFNQLRDRTKNFLDELLKKDYKNVLICTHGGVIAGFIHFTTTGKFKEENLPDYPKTGIITCIEEGVVSYRDFN